MASKIIPPSTRHFVCLIIDAVGRVIIFVIFFLFWPLLWIHLQVNSMEDDVFIVFPFQ